MGTEDTSVNDLEFVESTFHNQTPRKLSDQSQNDINSSLVFGNEILSKNVQTQKDDTLREISDKQENDRISQGPNTINDRPTQNDDTFGLIQNPSDTPFLEKLKDPFDETYNESLMKLSIETPSINKTVDLQERIPVSIKMDYKNKFDKIRNEANESGIDYETEGHDTMVVFDDRKTTDNNSDTQVINVSSTDDTLKFSASAIGDDTLGKEHVDENQETQLDFKNKPYKSYSQGETQVITCNLDDTQIIEKLSERDVPEELNKLHSDQENSIPSTQDKESKAIEVPSTIEKHELPRPQVVNTQEEDPESTPSGRVDLSIRPVYSSSQRLVEEGEEIITDDEKERDQKPHLREIYYDDSLLIHKHNHDYKRKLSSCEDDDRQQKYLKVSPNININDNGDRRLSNISKTPLSLRNKYYKQFAMTPSEIDESSPVIRKTDILVFPNRSSPSIQNDNTLIHIHNSASGIKVQPGISSSPTKYHNIIEMGIDRPEIDYSKSKVDKDVGEINSEDNSSELEDIDTANNTQQHQHHLSERIANKGKLYNNNETTEVTPRYSKDHVNNINLIEIGKSLNQRKEDELVLEESLNLLTELHVSSMRSVWASFKFNMYTGTLAKVGNESLIIEFEEGSSPIKNSDLYLLDIRIGDKIRIRTSKYKFVVTGLAYHSNGDNITCMRGYNTVLLRRVSKAKGKKFEELQVSLFECFMELSDWIQHQQKFQLKFEGVDLLKKEGGMFLTTFVPNLRRTPTRSARYSNTPDIAEYDFKYRNGPLISPTKKYESIILNRDTPHLSDSDYKLFSGMIFCLTFGKNIDTDKKDMIKKAIEDNGGFLLENGFEDILNYSSTSQGSLSLESHFLSGFTFGAVISNNYCRSAKYLQALALGWPILSDYFIFDCIKDNDKIHSWPTYLLPAGHSQHFGCIKSLDIFRFRQNIESKIELSYQLGNNSHLLHGFFIIIMDNKANLKTAKTCEFIFHAFGAKTLKYCSSVREATEEFRIQSNEQMLLYDNNDTIKDEFHKPNTETTRGSRTRSQAKANKKSMDQTLLPIAGKSKKVGFIDWEWVVQCVISGYIWDPEYIQVVL